jgi:CheY-like chemotaxis protein/PAS domain-containing protein
VSPHQDAHELEGAHHVSSFEGLLDPELETAIAAPDQDKGAILAETQGASFVKDEAGDEEGSGEPRFLNMLSERARCFLFSYSPKLKSLVAWSSNAKDILGVSDNEIVREGNLFMRHVHPEDRFRVLAALEQALRGECRYEITYRWIRPDVNELRWIHCRAALNTISPSAKGAGPTAATFSALGLESDQVLLEGILMDVTQSDVAHLTEPKEDGEFSAESLAAMPALTFLIDRDLRLVKLIHPAAPASEAVHAAHQNTSNNSQLHYSQSRSPLKRRFSPIESFDFGDSMFEASDFVPGRLVLPAFGTETLRHHYARVFEQLLNGSLPSFHTRLQHVEPPLSLDLFPWKSGDTTIGIFGLVNDASNVVMLERQISDLRRAEGLRSLAAGVSHHINNVLQAIIGQATVMREHPEDRGLVERSAASISDLVTRASELTQQLFLFDDSPQGALQPIDLNLSVMAAVSAAEELFASPLEIQVSFGNPAAVLAKQQPLIDSIRELLRTAREHTVVYGTGLRSQSAHAPRRATSVGEPSPSPVGPSPELPSSPGAKQESQLTIRTFQAEVHAHEVPSTRPGHYAHLVIAETRKLGGTSEAPLRRMRSLHSVTSSSSFRRAQTVVERFGGTITAQLPPEGGFSISLLLPALIADEGRLFSVDPAAAPEILLIDDDTLVLQTVEAMLKNAGYRCVTAQSAHRARSVAQAFQETLKVALVDAVMPGENELTIIKDLKSAIPDLVVIGFTGAASEKGEGLLGAGAERILRKPVDPMVLRDTIRSVLQPTDTAANS